MSNSSFELATLTSEQRMAVLNEMIEKIAEERAREIVKNILSTDTGTARNRVSPTEIRPTYDGEAVTPELSQSQIRNIRRLNATSPKDFQTKFGVSARTMEGWEQGRRKPDAVARILLRVIASNPQAVRDAVSVPATVWPI